MTDKELLYAIRTHVMAAKDQHPSDIEIDVIWKHNEALAIIDQYSKLKRVWDETYAQFQELTARCPHWVIDADGYCELCGAAV